MRIVLNLEVVYERSGVSDCWHSAGSIGACDRGKQADPTSRFWPQWPACWPGRAQAGKTIEGIQSQTLKMQQATQ
jgi:hypothetical protein